MAVDRSVQAISDRKMERVAPWLAPPRVCPHLDERRVRPKKAKSRPSVSDWIALFRALFALSIACIGLHAMATIIGVLGTLKSNDMVIHTRLGIPLFSSTRSTVDEGSIGMRSRPM